MSKIKDEVPADLWQMCSSRLTKGRRNRLLRAAGNRTNWIRVVLQDVCDPHNISACMRSCDAFGISTIDIVSAGGTFKASTPAKGVGKWLNINIYNNIEECIENLKKSGYMIALAMPGNQSFTLEDSRVDHPVAIVFGNEKSGVSPVWKSQADYCFTIPTLGLVESLNISVACAISTYQFANRARKNIGDEKYFISSENKNLLLSKWFARDVKEWRLEYERSR